VKVLIYVFANQHTGLGHWYRMNTLANELIMQNHHVCFASDKQPNYPVDYWIECGYLSETDYQFAKDRYKPDWIVVDLPGTIPDYAIDTNVKLCLIDGVGHPLTHANLNISQGRNSSEYCAPDYLLLRRTLRHYKWSGKPDNDFVFGGSYDELGLCNLYQTSKLNKNSFVISPYHMRVDGEAIFGLMALSNRAIIGIGMIAWELAYLGIKTYAFSKTDKHLEAALWMNELGLIKAYPKIGLPNKNEFIEFVNQDFEITGEQPDLKGAKRVVRLLEDD